MQSAYAVQDARQGAGWSGAGRLVAPMHFWLWLRPEPETPGTRMFTARGMATRENVDSNL